MANHDIQEREVDRIYWPDQRGDEDPSLRATETKRLVYQNRYMGDRNNEWILVIEGGVEVSRHNVRFLDTIIWKQSAAGA